MSKRTELVLNDRKEFGKEEPAMPVPPPPPPPPNPVQLAEAATKKVAAETKPVVPEQPAPTEHKPVEPPPAPQAPQPILPISERERQVKTIIERTAPFVAKGQDDPTVVINTLSSRFGVVYRDWMKTAMDYIAGIKAELKHDPSMDHESVLTERRNLVAEAELKFRTGVVEANTAKEKAIEAANQAVEAHKDKIETAKLNLRTIASRMSGEWVDKLTEALPADPWAITILAWAIVLATAGGDLLLTWGMASGSTSDIIAFVFIGALALAQAISALYAGESGAQVWHQKKVAEKHADNSKTDANLPEPYKLDPRVHLKYKMSTWSTGIIFTILLVITCIMWSRAVAGDLTPLYRLILIGLFSFAGGTIKFFASKKYPEDVEAEYKKAENELKTLEATTVDPKAAIEAAETAYTEQITKLTNDCTNACKIKVDIAAFDLMVKHFLAALKEGNEVRREMARAFETACLEAFSRMVERKPELADVIFEDSEEEGANEVKDDLYAIIRQKAREIFTNDFSDDEFVKELEEKSVLKLANRVRTETPVPDWKKVEQEVITKIVSDREAAEKLARQEQEKREKAEAEAKAQPETTPTPVPAQVKKLVVVRKFGNLLD